MELIARARALEDKGDYQGAEPLYRRALGIRETVLGAEHPATAAALDDLAGLLQAKGDFAAAEPLFRRALAISEKALGPDHPDTAFALESLAGLLQDKGDYAEAERLYRRALAISQKAHGPEHPDTAKTLNNLAGLLRTKGDYAGAEPLLRRALAIQEKTPGPEHPDTAMTLNIFAGLLQDKGDFPTAERLYRRALAINEKAHGPEHRETAATLNNLGLLLDARGDYAGAERLLRRSLSIREKVLGPEHPTTAINLNNLALPLRAKGDDAGAEQLYRRSLAISEKTLGLEHPETVNVVNNLAVVVRDRGNFAAAERLHRRALAATEKARGLDHTETAHVLGELAATLWTKGDHAAAEPLMRRALAINQKSLGPGHPDTATALNNLAILLGGRGDDAAAEPLYRQALAVAETSLGPEHPRTGTVLGNLAELLRTRGDHAAADQLDRRAAAINEKALGPEHPEAAKLLNRLASRLLDMGEVRESVAITRRLITARRAAKAVALPAIWRGQAEQAVETNDALDLSFRVVQQANRTRAAEALHKFGLRLAAGSDGLGQLVRRDQDLAEYAKRLDKQLLEGISLDPRKRDAAREAQLSERIKAALAERRTIAERLATEHPRFAALTRPEAMSVEAVQRFLDADEALVVVDIGVGQEPSYAWMVTRDGGAWAQVASSSEVLNKNIAALRRNLDVASGSDFDTRLAFEVYQQVFGPLRDALGEKARWSVVVGGSLASVPLSVLITEDSQGRPLKDVSWVVRRHAVTILPSVASLQVLRGPQGQSSAKRPLIGFGDPVFNRAQPVAGRAMDLLIGAVFRGGLPDIEALSRGLPPLPETADELRSVGRAVQASAEDLLLGDRATESAVKQRDLRQYRIVYFATHGLVSEEVGALTRLRAEPGLALTLPRRATAQDDGLLTASEIGQLKLNADWVVLSACNTAAGGKLGGEALSGLAQAFIYAGTRSLLVSHWAVESHSTAALMAGTFGAIQADRRLSHAEALRRSILAMIDSPSEERWRDPCFWGPFIVVGEPRKGAPRTAN